MRMEQNALVELREIKFDMFFMNFDGVRICSWMFLNFEEKMKNWFDGRKNESPRKLKFFYVTKSRFIKVSRVQIKWVHSIFKFYWNFIRKILFLSNSRDLGRLHSIFDLKKCYTFVGSGDQIQVWKGTILLDLVQNGNKSLIYVFNRG